MEESSGIGIVLGPSSCHNTASRNTVTDTDGERSLVLDRGDYVGIAGSHDDNEDIGGFVETPAYDDVWDQQGK